MPTLVSALVCAESHVVHMVPMRLLQVRAAVQANIFEAIHIVDERAPDTKDGGAAAAEGEGAADNRVDNGDREGRRGGGGASGTKGAKDAKLVYVPPSKASKGVTDKDIGYYSLCNAPLITIKRFDTVASFFENVRADEAAALHRLGRTHGQPCAGSGTPPLGAAGGVAGSGCSSTVDGAARGAGGNAVGVRRKIVGVDGGTTWFGAPLNLYAPDAMAALGRCGYVAMGAEDQGLPKDFLERCNDLVMIPCLSASINVGCAFTAVLTIMQLVAFRATAAT